MLRIRPARRSAVVSSLVLLFAACSSTEPPPNDEPHTTANNPPVAQADTASVPQGGTVIIPVLANDSDPDGDPLTILGVTQPSAGTATHDGERVTFTAPAAFTGTARLSYEVSDGRDGDATGEVTVTVTALTSQLTVEVNTGLEVAIGASSVLSEAKLKTSSTLPNELTYTLKTAPQKGTITNAGAAVGLGGTFTQTHIGQQSVFYECPATATAGTDSFELEVTDGVSSTSITVSVVVKAPPPAPPTIDVVSSPSVMQGSRVCLTAANLHAADAQGSTEGVVFRLEGTSGGTLEHDGAALADGDEFTNADVASGTICYAHTYAWGPSGCYIRVVAGKAGLWSPRTQLDVTVIGNTKPTWGPRSNIFAQEAGTVTLTTSHFMAYDDGPASGIIYTVAALPSHGTLERLSLSLGVGDTFSQGDVESGLVTYVHDGTETTTDGFTLELSDGVWSDGAQSMFIQISCSNDPPTATLPSPTTVLEGGELELTLTGEDEESPVLMWVIDSLPSRGILTRKSDEGHHPLPMGAAAVETETLLYLPGAHEYGTDSFSFHMLDGGNVSDSVTVDLTITEQNTAPVANADSFSVRRGRTVSLDVLANDTDADPLDTLTITGATASHNGTISFSASSITYTPDDTGPFAGDDALYTETISYTASDGHSDQAATGVVTVTVLPRVLFVDADAAGPAHDGASWTTAYTSVAEAAAAVASGKHDEIWIAQGRYVAATSSAPVLSLSAVTDVRVYGGFAGTESALAERPLPLLASLLDGDRGADGPTADDSPHVVSLASVSRARLDGLEIARGFGVSGSGGGVLASGAEIVLARLDVHDNVSDLSGGGILLNATAGSAEVSDCRLANNLSAEGGGLTLIGSSATVQVLRSVFEENRATSVGGGSRDLLSGALRVADCDFIGNRAQDEGGGMWTDGAEVVNCSFVDNEANLNGGGINLTGPTSVLQSTFLRNVGLQGGALMVAASGQASVANSAFFGNGAESGHQLDAVTGTRYDLVHSCAAGWLVPAGGTSSDNAVLHPARGNPFVETASGQVFLGSYFAGAANPCVDMGDSALLTTQLPDWAERTTRADNALDSGGVDAGRHYRVGPVIRTFEVSPRALPSGATSAQLSWDIAACPGAGCTCVSMPGGEVRSGAGSATVSAVAGQTFTLTCSNAAGVVRRARAHVGRVLYVAPSELGGDDAAAGTSWATAKATPQAAVDAARAYDQVWLSIGLYNGAVTMAHGVDVYGGLVPGATTLANRSSGTVLDAQGAGTVVTGASHTSLDGVSLQGGTDSGFSASRKTRVSLVNVQVVSNSAATVGGGVRLGVVSATLDGVRIALNTAVSRGAGLYVVGAAAVEVANSQVISNGSSDVNIRGGGVYLDRAAPYVHHTVLMSNSAGTAAGSIGYGGGVYAYQSAPWLEAVTFAENTAGYGGAFYATGSLAGAGQSSSAVVNSTFDHNTAASGPGAAVFVTLTAPTMVNLTVTRNDSPGGFVLEGGTTGLKVANAAVYGNTGAGDANGVTFEGSCLQTFAPGQRLVERATLQRHGRQWRRRHRVLPELCPGRRLLMSGDGL